MENENINALNVRVKQKSDYMAKWAEVQNSFVPLRGEGIVYLDRSIITYADNTKKYCPGYKIGDGEHTLAQLAFVDEETYNATMSAIAQVQSALNTHISDTEVHVSVEDREFWDSKAEVKGDTLILTLSRNK